MNCVHNFRKNVNEIYTQEDKYIKYIRDQISDGKLMYFGFIRMEAHRSGEEFSLSADGKNPDGTFDILCLGYDEIRGVVDIEYRLYSQEYNRIALTNLQVPKHKCTEEWFFMQSTVHDLRDLTHEDILLFIELVDFLRKP